MKKKKKKKGFNFPPFKCNLRRYAKAALEAGGYEVVFDAVYNPLETTLLREAKEVGCTQASGLDMFVGQAALQFQLFTGKDAAKDLMRSAVLDSM